MEIGRRVYYEKETGNIICDIGERSGGVVETTVEDDFQLDNLKDKNLEEVDYIQLEYGQFVHEFHDCILYKINIETKEIVFIF